MIILSNPKMFRNRSNIRQLEPLSKKSNEKNTFDFKDNLYGNK